MGRGCPPAFKKVTEHEENRSAGSTLITPQLNPDGTVALDGHGNPIYKTRYKSKTVYIHDKVTIEKRSGVALGFVISPFTFDKAIYGQASVAQAGPGDIDGMIMYRLPSNRLPEGDLFLGGDYKILF